MIEKWTIGSVCITKIEELVEVIDGSTMIVEATPDNIKKHHWLRPSYADDDGNIIFSIHAFVIEANNTLIVVDTCLSENKASTIDRWDHLSSAFLNDFVDCGFETEKVDFVLCTHLHEDHVGWNTMQKDGQWVPTFPNARYLFAEKEWTYWQDTDYSNSILEPSLKPIIDNELHFLIDPPYSPTEGITIIPTPGHTPGHTSIEITSQGNKAVIIGDIMHNPVQCCEPYWNACSDTDPSLAKDTRINFLKQYSEEDTLILGTHFPTPTSGKIKKSKKSWKFIPKR